MSESIVKNKSFAFAVRVVNFYKILSERKEFVMSKQFLRFGTSIGANVREAVNGQSKADLYINYQFLKKNAMKVSTGWSC